MKTLELQIPDEMSEDEIKEWVKIKVDRFYNAKLLPPNYAEVEADKQAFVTANKMEAIKPVEEVKEEPIEEPIKVIEK